MKISEVLHISFTIISVALLSYLCYDIIAVGEYTHVDLLGLAISSMILATIARPQNNG